MRSTYRNFCRLLFCAALCLGTASIGLCQSPGGWSLEAPPNSVELISVGQGPMLGFLKFTFKNVSGKTIILLDVGDLHGHHVGLNAFATGGTWGAVAPGTTTSLEFSSQDFSAGSQTAKDLRVAAIFYEDGSGFGPDKTHVEDRMLGEALETKRDADLLSASPDHSTGGFNKVAAQIRSQPLNTNAEAVQLLHGIALPGISQALIKGHLAHPSVFFRFGANDARDGILGDIALAKSNDARAMAGPEIARQREQEKRSHALADLAKKYSSLSEWQVQYLKKVYQDKLTGAGSHVTGFVPQR